jgi:hypothetical protein
LEVKMKNGSYIMFRVLGVLLVLGLIVGAGAIGYRAGMTQGIMQSPAVAKAIENAAENGQAAPIPQMMYQRNFGYGYSPMPVYGGYGYSPMMRGGFSHGFNPIGGILFLLLIVFVVGSLMRMIFFRGIMWRHAPWAYGPHGQPWGTPPWAKPEGEGAEESKKE